MAPADPAQTTDASRYDVMRVLGSGGMACVYEVFDRSQQRRLALKRLQPTSDEQRRRRLVELFEREFYTLSELSHPAVVQAYDYGVDGDGPFYTMELLEGGELQAIAPLPYKQACLLARDLCSALSLLHSRRLVYRDLNPRNVHCDAQGTPKLIDFGAIAAMGPCAQVVGTPAYCAPEALDLEPLDARTDLFSLGATLYFAVTGHHAFPARTFAQLRQLWDVPVTRPSAYVRDLPAPLEALILDLLKLDPAGRPPNAGELMEQLAAIAGQTVDEHAGVMQAYLSTPSMVGREPQLAQMQAKLKRAAQSRGSAVWVTSASGAGRSRFLAACQLVAKMSGALVVHAASGEVSGDYGVLRALADSLLHVAPELARRAAREGGDVLARILPQLAATPPTAAADAAPLGRPQVLASIRDWLTAVARERTLILAIDDYHRCDEPSAASFAWLAHGCDDHAMLLIASSEVGASAFAPAALKLYESSAARVSLENLTEAESVELLRSLFGNVPHVSALGHKLYAIAGGNPRDTMRLAQTMVDRGAAKYRAGAWSLPASFDAGWLPQSMHQAVIREFETLDPVARHLARVLSLADDRALSFEECALACGEHPVRAVHEALQRLIRVQFTKLQAERYTIAHRGLHAALRSGAEPDELHAAHRQISEIFSRRGNEPFRDAKHLLRSGDTARGVDALVAFSVDAQARTDKDPLEYVQLVLSMPDDWLSVFDDGVLACKQLGRPRVDTFRLRNRLASLLNVMGAASHVHLLALIRQLSQDSGLDAYARLDPALDPGERLKRALGEVKQIYDTGAPHERGLEPALAIRALVVSLNLGAGMVALGLDYSLWQALPSIAPLQPLSPAFGVTERLVGAVAARVAGRHEYVRAAYAQILERLAEPDRAGLEPSNHRFMRYGVMYGLALIEAGMGLPSCLSWAETLATEPLHAVNALQVRMVHELWLGRVHEADQVRELAEVRRIETGTRQMADGSHLVWQMLAHAYSDDLTRLKHVVEELRALAKRHVGWMPVVQYALAEHQRMRGDHAQALEHVNASLAQITAGEHQIWPHSAAAQINALCALDRVEEAVQAGERHLQAGLHAELGYFVNYIRMAQARACARLGQHTRALALAEEVLQAFRALGTSGLNLLLAYETCSRVAWHAGKLEDHEQFALMCAEMSRGMSGQALHARAARVLQQAHVGAVAASELDSASLATSMVATDLKSAFSACEEPRQRAERALQLLLTQSRAEAGVLYLLGTRGPTLAARVGPEPAPDVVATVLDLIDSEVRQRGMVTASADAEPGSSQLATMVSAHSLVLLCHQTPEGCAVSGVAALAVDRAGAYVHPGALAARLSRMLTDAGDVVPVDEA